MPFLPLYFRQLGVEDVGEIALWSGLSLGVDAGDHCTAGAVLGPAWRSLRAQDHGRAIAGELRRRDGGHGLRDQSLACARAACGPGVVRRVRRAGADDGGRISAAGTHGAGHRTGADGAKARAGARADLRRRRGADRRAPHAFLVTALSFAIALVLVFVIYQEPVTKHPGEERDRGPVTLPNRPRVRELRPADGGHLRAAVRRSQFRSGLAAVRGAARHAIGANSARGRPVVFDRRGNRGARQSSVRIAPAAIDAARDVIATGGAGAAACAFLYAVAPGSLWVFVVTPIFGAAIGVATTAAYTAAGAVIPARARGAGFGFLSTASLTGVALSPIVSGLLGATSIRAVFLLDGVGLVVLAILVSRLMIGAPRRESRRRRLRRNCDPGESRSTAPGRRGAGESRRHSSPRRHRRVSDRHAVRAGRRSA